jgi:hypothetical protein
MDNVQNCNPYTFMANLNHCHKPLESRNVNVKRCIKFRKDSFLLRAYSCTHFLNPPHLTLQKRSCGSLPRGSIECVHVWFRYENVITYRMVSRMRVTVLTFIAVCALRIQPVVHTIATSFQKKVQQEKKKLSLEERTSLLVCCFAHSNSCLKSVLIYV